MKQITFIRKHMISFLFYSNLDVLACDTCAVDVYLAHAFCASQTFSLHLDLSPFQRGHGVYTQSLGTKRAPTLRDLLKVCKRVAHATTKAMASGGASEPGE